MKLNGKRIKDATDAELEFALKDLNEVIQVQENGWRTIQAHNPHNKNLAYMFPELSRYQDEAAAVFAEMRRREKCSAPKCSEVLLEVQTILQDLSQDNELYNRIPWKRIKAALEAA